MEKTPMQELIEYLEGIKERDNIPTHVITTAKNYLQIEKQVIEKSFLDGYFSCEEEKFITSQDYYNKKFKQ